MKKFSEQFKIRAGKVKLREDERHELRQRLLSYMEYHPLPHSDGLTQVSSAASVNVFFKYVTSRHIWGKAVGLASVFLLVFIPAMAENALPGETLYPVKVRFNEELRGALASSPYQKIEWETERLERRVNEARLLASSGRLTPAVEAGVAISIKQHSDAAKESINSIRINDRSEAALAEIALVSALEVSAEMLEDKDAEIGASSTSALSSAVNQARVSVSTGEELPPYDKVMARLETETTRAYEYLDSLSETIPSESQRDIERRLSDVKVKTEDASKLKKTDETEASKLLVEALSSTRKVISFMTNLNVRNNILIEDLVPAALSPEQRVEVIESKLELLNNDMVEVESVVGTLASTSVDYKDLSKEIESYRSLRTSIDTAIEENNLASAEKNLISISELVVRVTHSIKVLGIEI